MEVPVEMYPIVGNEEFTPEFFDESSKAWRENKKTVAGGWFAYRCQYLHSTGRRCAKAVFSEPKVTWYQEAKREPPPSTRFCKQHIRRQHYISEIP